MVVGSIWKDTDNLSNWGVSVCTSGARPTAYEGRLIYETDTDKVMKCTNAVGPVWAEVGAGGGMDNPATADLDMDNHNIIGADKIIADAGTDLTFQVAVGQSFIFQKV